MENNQASIRCQACLVSPNLCFCLMLGYHHLWLNKAVFSLGLHSMCFSQHGNQLRSNCYNCRLPRDLMEKMPSASNSPMMGRKVSSEDVESSKKSQPLSVASMVRRFERDNGLDKGRGGVQLQQELERSNSSLNKTALVKESRSSSQTSSLNSSQGHLPSAVTASEAIAASTVVKAVESSSQESHKSSSKKASTSAKTTSNRTVSSLS